MKKVAKRTAIILIALAAAFSIGLLACNRTTQEGTSMDIDSSPITTTSSDAVETSPQTSSPDLKNNPDEGVYGELQEAAYSDSGDSLGNVYRLETAQADDGTLMVVKREKDVWSDPLSVCEYRAPDDLLAKIEEIADSAGIKTWGELPMSEFIVYDASTPSVTLTYSAADPSDSFPQWITFTRDNIMPDDGEALKAIRNELAACVVEDNLIREYTEE